MPSHVACGYVRARLIARFFHRGLASCILKRSLSGGCKPRASHRQRVLVQETFPPTLREAPSDIVSKSHAIFSLLPLGFRSHRKLCNIIHEEMEAIGGQALGMPSLTLGSLWKQSGRWDQMGSELFRLQDRHGNDYCLGPTHEEPFTSLVAQNLSSWKQLPWRLYQIGSKYRDEKRPRYGLIRSREFVMKDMYTFDVDDASAQNTYDLVTEAYATLFNRLNLPFTQVEADTGNIGGTRSHEFQVPSDIGDDVLVTCPKCNRSANEELWDQGVSDCVEDNCDAANAQTHRGLEIGHAFLLGTKYSDAFQANFADAQDTQQAAIMGCYGLGVSRILSAIVEQHNDENGIVWPPCVAPYRAIIIVLNGSNKKSQSGQELKVHGEHLYDMLQNTSLARDVILDTSDRHIIIGKSHDLNRLEIQRRENGGKRATEYLSVNDFINAVET